MDFSNSKYNSFWNILVWIWFNYRKNKKMSYLKDLYKEAEFALRYIEDLDQIDPNYQEYYDVLNKRLKEIEEEIIQKEENLDNQIIK